MKGQSSAFRSVDDWKSALMTLPDNGFFELLRSVFGNIKTPFSKQRLMDDLFKLLSKDEIRKTIAAYIDEQDHKIIAAVALLNEPAPGELENFFAGELSSAELHSVVLNLEERLILYRFRKAPAESDHPRMTGRGSPAEGILRLALNPVLEKVLAPFAADIGPLFPSFPTESTVPAKNIPAETAAPKETAAAKKGKKTPENNEELPPSVCISDSRILAALFAFLYGYSEDELLKIETEAQFRGLRKKVLEEGKKVFPNLDLELAVRTLIHLELFRAEGCCIIPNAEKIAGFSELSPLERQEYWAAGVYLCLNETADNDMTILYRSRLRKIVSTIHRFMGLIDTSGKKKYLEVTLRRFMELLGKEDAGTSNAWGSRLFDDRVQLPFVPFLAAMEKAGLLEKKESCWKAVTIVTPGEDPAGPVIVMDTAFSLILYPEIAFADAMNLASFCSVKILDTNNSPDGTSVCFELTRESAVRGFDQGMGAAGMIELLNRLSLNRLDENLNWTLKDWETRYAGVSLHQGIILSLAEDRRYLADARPLTSLIRRTLAPGIYLLASADKAEAARALRKAGVDIIAQPPADSRMDQKVELSWLGASGLLRSSFPSLGSSGIAEFLNHDESEAELPSPEEADSIKQKLRRALEKMRLGKQERDELEARIERRLILSEAQLEGTSLRYEKLEARGLDYTGKTAIAKQALESGSQLDVSWPGPGGEIKRVLGTPAALEKKEGESILVIKIPAAGDSAASETIRIPLGKISLLRRIKQSIFGE